MGVRASKTYRQIEVNNILFFLKNLIKYQNKSVDSVLN
jgi:hypothetical protein